MRGASSARDCARWVRCEGLGPDPRGEAVAEDGPVEWLQLAFLLTVGIIGALSLHNRVGVRIRHWRPSLRQRLASPLLFRATRFAISSSVGWTFHAIAPTALGTIERLIAGLEERSNRRGT
jgi:hypothetical protein